MNWLSKFPPQQKHVEALPHGIVVFIVLLYTQAFGVWVWLRGVVIFIKCHSVLMSTAGFYVTMAFFVTTARKSVE